MSREKNLIKNTFIIGIGTLLPKLTSFITLPVITAGLTKAELGTYDLISTLVSLFLPVVTLQLRTAAFRFLIDYRNDLSGSRRVISNIIGFIIPASFVSLAILYFALGKLSPNIRLLIVLYYFFDIFLSTFLQIARGLSYNKIYSASSLLDAVSKMILIVVFVLAMGSGLVGALLASLISTILGTFYVFFRCGIYKYIKVSALDKATLLLLLKYSWPMIPNSMSLWALSVSDRLVLTMFIGVEATAVYAVANKIPALLTSVQNTFIYAWQENASVAVEDSDVDEYYTKMYSGISRLLTGGMALIIALAPFLFKLFVKGDYSDAFNQMPILFLAVFFSCISSFLGGIYVARKKTINVGITTIIAATINLAIDFALIKHIGIYAASVSTLVSYLFLTIYRMLNIKKFQNMRYKYSELIAMCACLVLMCLISSESIDAKAVINIILGIAIAIMFNRGIIKGLMRKIVRSFRNADM